jgi:hypothetical protein
MNITFKTQPTKIGLYTETVTEGIQILKELCEENSDQLIDFIPSAAQYLKTAVFKDCTIRLVTEDTIRGHLFDQIMIPQRMHPSNHVMMTLCHSPFSAHEQVIFLED